MGQKLYEVLQWASLFLEKNNREPKVAEILLMHHLGVSKTQFLTQMRDEVPADVAEKFRLDIENHATTGVPIQYLMGYSEFYGRKFTVNSHVLIPRMETEELVQYVIHQAPKNDPITIVDIGTGSGIIAITLALELPNAQVFAIDISTEALSVAKQNAKDLGANITFLEGSFLTPFLENNLRADIIVSNPPYISEAEREDLSDTVVNYDPELALFAEDNGLRAYKEIVAQLPNVIKPNGSVAFEIGHTQGEAVKGIILAHFPHVNVKIIKDINGKDRIIYATGF